MKPTIVGVAGGSASGKTTIVENLRTHFGKNIVIIPHDNYYYGHDDLPFEKRKNLNYDHPSSFETSRLIEDIKKLKEGKAIQIPTYDYKIHTRAKEVLDVEPKPIVVVEGILVLNDPKLRDLMDMKIFVDTDADIRLMRRILRDVNERARTVESVLEQYITTVKPMHESFVEPSKKYADIIIPHGGENEIAVDMLFKHLESTL